MRVLRLAFLLSGVALAGATAAEPAPTRTLSLQESIAIALEHNFDIQVRRYEPRLSRYSLAGTYGAYDPSFSAAGSHEYRLSPGGLDSQGRSFGGVESESDNFSAGINGLLPWGLIYSVGASVSDQQVSRPGSVDDLTRPYIFTNQYYDLAASQPVTQLFTNYAQLPMRVAEETTSGQAGFLQLRQPLLKNFWIDGTRLQIIVDKKSLQMNELALIDQVMRTVTSVEQAYYNLIYQEESVRVQEKALELADRLLAENKRRVEVGAMAPLDEKQAESQAAASRADLLEAQAARDTAERLLKNLLSDNYTNDWAGVKVVPTEKLLAVPQQFDLQESWRQGLERPDLKQARVGLEKQDSVIRFQRNQLYPQLDLVGTYGYSGSGREYSGAFGQIGGGDNPFYSFGAQITVPLGRTSVRNNFKSAKATKEQLQLMLKQSEQAALISIENSIANARTSLERVDATRQARLYAEAALQAEQKKLERGKSTSFFVLQLQRDLTGARSAEIRALADYNIALAQVALNEGTTLTRHRVDVDMK